MITCHRSNLEQRCTERGYTLAEVMPCVVSQDGDQWTIDVEHPSYPRSPVGRGPGTELKKLLASFGITATPSCSCNAGAALMDELEARFPGWCEGHMDEIVGWMRKEAAARGLPFLDVVGRLLVRRAVRNARQNLPG